MDRRRRSATAGPLPDRIDQDDDRRQHQYRRQRYIDRPLCRGFGPLSQRQEIIPDRAPAGDQGRRRHKRQRHDRDPAIPGLSHIDDDGRRDAQRDRGQQLVRNAEHGPDGR